MMLITERLKLKEQCSHIVLMIIALCVVQPGLVRADDYRVSTTEIPYPVKYNAIKFMTKVYNELGHTLTILEYPQGRALIESNAGLVDAELFRVEGIDKQYKNLIQVPGAISFSRILAYVKKDSHLTPKNWTDLKGLRVGYVIGAKIVERKLKGIRSVGVHRPEQLFDMLKRGRLDVAVYTATTAKIHDDIIPINTPLLKVPVYHYIHKKNKHLLILLRDSIQQLNERTMDTVLEKKS
ncbi:MAG: hypothetical protein ISR69_09770 [Gammaproteobacteria bacterium]|nr:hypothetical protein [Gammaproteobacteria bacterium]